MGNCSFKERLMSAGADSKQSLHLFPHLGLLSITLGCWALNTFPWVRRLELIIQGYSLTFKGRILYYLFSLHTVQSQCCFFNLWITTGVDDELDAESYQKSLPGLTLRNLLWRCDWCEHLQGSLSICYKPADAMVQQHALFVSHYNECVLIIVSHHLP